MSDYQFIVPRISVGADMALRLLGWPRDQALAAIAKARPIADHARGCVRYADDADMAVQQLGLA